jgi:hypothetical protein
VFGIRNFWQGGDAGESAGGSSSSLGREKEVLMFSKNRSPSGEMEDGRFTLSVVEQKRNSGRFEIVLKDRNEDILERQLKSSEEIQALLSHGGYALASAAPQPESVAIKGEIPETAKTPEISETVRETAVHQAGNREKKVSEPVKIEVFEVREKSGQTSLVRFEKADEDFANLLGEASQMIETLAEVLNEQKDRLRDEFYKFENALKVLEKAVNTLVEEDEKLLESADGKEIGEDEMARILERQKGHRTSLEIYKGQLGNCRKKSLCSWIRARMSFLWRASGRGPRTRNRRVPSRRWRRRSEKKSMKPCPGS